MTIAVYPTQNWSGYPKAETCLSSRVRLTNRWASRALSTPAGVRFGAGKYLASVDGIKLYYCRDVPIYRRPLSQLADESRPVSINNHQEGFCGT